MATKTEMLDKINDNFSKQGVKELMALLLDGNDPPGVTISAASTDGIVLSGAYTDALDISGACTNYVNINNVSTTSGIGLHFIDAYLGKTVETGSYSSSASKGVTVTQTNARPHTFLADDAGTKMAGGDIRALLSRLLLTVDSDVACTINAMRAQLKLNDGVDLSSATSVSSPFTAYFEMAGTGARTLAGYTAAARATIEEGASGTTTISGSSWYSGLEVNLNSGRTYTETGSMAAIHVTKTSTSVWPTGLKLLDSTCTIGIDIGACATGLTFTGACTTAAITMDGATFAAGDHEVQMRNTVSGDKTVICSGAAAADADIVTAVGADADIADGSLYMSIVDGAGKLFIKSNDEWKALAEA